MPIVKDKVGKDVVVDWSLLDKFDTGKQLWVDANGLQMMHKKLNHRNEFNFTSNNTVAANYYPMTSAIAVRDFSKANITKGI